MVKIKNISPKIKIMRDSLLVNNEILVLSDLHIGYEDVLAGKGIFPRRQLKDIIEKLNGIFFDLNMEGVKLKQIVICGDLKHEFGEISDAEWRETVKLLDFLIKQCKDIVLVQGNHDKILGPIARKREIKLKDYYLVGDVCFLHGDKLHEDCLDKCKTIVTGHLHPSITLGDDYKNEKYKCFLKGRWKRKQVYVLPSFSDVSFGYDLMRKDGNEEHLFIHYKKLKGFEVIVYNNKNKEEYNFGKLKKLIKKQEI